jgi:methionyl-tRNA formyltransferase
MTNMNPKIIFMGTSEFAIASLQKLIEKNYQIVACYTKPDQKQNRGLNLEQSPVKKFLKKNYPQIKIIQPKSLKTEENLKEFYNLKPELVIVASYGLFLPKEILEFPKYKCINLHPSLLPKYRGPSPIQTAFLEDQKETGLSLIIMNKQMDAGDLIYQEKIKINQKENFEELFEKLAEKSAEILIKILPKYLDGKIKPQKQNDKKASFTKIFKKADGKISFKKETASQILKKLEVFKKWPGTYFFFQTPKRLIKINLIQAKKIKKSDHIKTGQVFKFKDNNNQIQIAVKTKKDFLILEKIKPEAKNTMSARDFINGYPSFIGTVLE